ncbi:MAG: AAA family ATPase [bacterium]|nr:AAA family ATPase [bacterium]
MMYQSEIRESDINELLEKVDKQNYKKYLYKMNLSQIRGFIDQAITFDFPVTALIAPNGGGKSTILGAAYIAYKDSKPSRFFSRNNQLDDSMVNWRIVYEIIDKEANPKSSIQRTASFDKKWSRRDFLNRNKVIEFGIRRTLPASERTELTKYARKSFNVSEDITELINPDIKNAVLRVLGSTTDEYSLTTIRERGRTSSILGSIDSLLSGRTSKGITYSEFNFGAGESSVIRMIKEIENAPSNSLILIEEIENGLHPIATTKMVEYLIDVAKRKSMQVIFTTHSQDALLPLPSQAIWGIFDWKLVQGKLDIKALRQISGSIKTKLIIYTEDEFSKLWVDAMLRAYRSEDDKVVAMEAVEIYAVGGDDKAIKFNDTHNSDPAFKIPSICIVDGDVKQDLSIEKNQLQLYGDKPEEYILEKVISILPEYGGQLAIKISRFDDAEKIAKAIRDARSSTRDYHNLYSKIGQNLRFTPVSTIKNAFVSIWAEAYSDLVNEFFKPIENLLPLE